MYLGLIYDPTRCKVQLLVAVAFWGSLREARFMGWEVLFMIRSTLSLDGYLQSMRWNIERGIIKSMYYLLGKELSTLDEKKRVLRDILKIQISKTNSGVLPHSHLLTSGGRNSIKNEISALANIGDTECALSQRRNVKIHPRQSDLQSDLSIDWLPNSGCKTWGMKKWN